MKSSLRAISPTAANRLARATSSLIEPWKMVRVHAGQLILLGLSVFAVGGMIGVERSILPLMGEGYEVKSKKLLMTSIGVFAGSKAIGSMFVGVLGKFYRP